METKVIQDTRRWERVITIRRSLSDTRMLRDIGIPLATVVLIILWTLVSPVFFRASNFENISRQASVLAILALGVTFVLMCGELDLSIGANVAAAGTFAALAYQQNGNIIVAGLVAVGFGALVGVVNGSIVIRLHISSFISTIGMTTVIRGLILAITGGSPISSLPDGFENLGTGSLGPLPLPVLLVATAFVISWIILDSTHVGREIRAVGGNARAAYLSGISTSRARILAFVFCGSLAGLAGLLLASRVHSGQPTAADGIELQAVAAAVLGGVSLYGGKGTLIGAVFGVLFISILTNGLNIVGVSTFIQNIVIGSALIAAVFVDGLIHRRSQAA